MFSAFIEIGGVATVAVILIFLVGGIIKGGLGFGLPLVTISLLPLVIPVELALAINSVVLPVSNLVQFVQARMMRETLVRFWPILLSTAAGVPVGIFLTQAINANTLLFAIGFFIVVFCVLSVKNPAIRVPARHEWLAAGLFGFVAGFGGAITTVVGPVYATFLVGIGAGRRQMISALGLFFLFAGVAIAGSFWMIGRLDMPRAMVALSCLPVVFIGMRTGDRIARHFSPDGFRRLVLAVLVGLGLYLMVRAMFGG